MIIKSYSELSRIFSYEDRFEYLKLIGRVGDETFGYDRYLNQAFYSSEEWKKVRNKVIARDLGCDMGHKDHEIMKHIIVHHINPITPEQLENRDPVIFDLENLICVSDRTHKAIHYSDSSLLPKGLVERTKNDTCPWKVIK